MPRSMLSRPIDEQRCVYGPGVRVAAAGGGWQPCQRASFDFNVVVVAGVAPRLVHMKLICGK